MRNTGRRFAFGMNTAAVLLGAALALEFASCASIKTFAATPRNVCAGAAVDVTWEAKGSVTLTSEPALDGTGPQKDKGTRRFTVNDDTRFTLEASGFGKSMKTQADIAVAPPHIPFTHVAECDAASRVLTATLEITHQVSPDFRVATVANTNDRKLVVDRDGHRVELAPGAVSAEFSGSPLQGGWPVTSPLASGETCAEALRSVRHRLQADFRLECGE